MLPAIVPSWELAYGTRHQALRVGEPLLDKLADGRNAVARYQVLNAPFGNPGGTQRGEVVAIRLPPNAFLTHYQPSREADTLVY